MIDDKQLVEAVEVAITVELLADKYDTKDVANAAIKIARPIIEQQCAERWQPIETAPKDVCVLIYSKEYSINSAWHSEAVDENGRDLGYKFFIGQTWGDCRAAIIEPTHWMPLPKPPEAKSALEGE